MEELFDPANFVWIIPLCVFGVLIIILTGFALRKEIQAIVSKLLFPYKNRYSMPAGIITKGSIAKDGTQTSYSVMKEDSGLPDTPLLLTPLNPHDLPVAIAAEKTEDSSAAAQKQDADKIPATEETEVKEIPFPQQAIPEEKPLSTVEKLRVFIKDFNAILFPQSQSCFSPQQNAVQSNAIDPNMTLPPVPPTPAAIKEEAEKEQQEVRQTPQPKLEVLEVPAIPALQPKAEEKAKGPYFIKDRYIIIFALLVLSGFVIFLTARVKLLSSIQQRQYIEIKQLKEQLSDAKGGNAGKKVIIYVPIGSNRIQK